MRFHFQARPGILALESHVSDLLCPPSSLHADVRAALDAFETFAYAGPSDVCRAPHGRENPAIDTFETSETFYHPGNEADDRDPIFAGE